MSDRRLEKTSTAGVYRRHAAKCSRGGKCACSYVVVWTRRGKQHKESFRTLAEAREAKGQKQAGDRRPQSRVTFGDYFENWITTYAGLTSRGFSETTRPEYERPIRAHAIPLWADWRFAEVEASDVRGLFGRMRREGASTSAIRKLRAALSAMFATAVEDDTLRSNPVSGVRIPAPVDGDEPEEEKAKALTRAEWGMLRAELPEGWHLFFDLLVQTGLRISEACGLTWANVSLGEHPRIEVREQFYRGERRKLKSKAAKRDLPLSPALAARLLAHRRDHYSGPDSPLFPSKAGTPLIAGKVRERVLAPAAIAVGLSEEVEDDEGKIRTKASIGFHSLRHTCASVLFDAGRNIKQVSTWLGHTDPAFTLRTYVHLLDEGVGDASCFDGLEGERVVSAASTSLSA